MKNVNELIEGLSANWDAVSADKMDLKKAKELSNIAGKLLKAASSTMAYDVHMGYNTKIDFFEKPVSDARKPPFSK